MYYLELLIRGLLMCGGLLGIGEYLRSKNVPQAFVPVITLSIIGCLMFGAGMLNVMPAMVWGICLAGWCVFICVKHRGRDTCCNRVSDKLSLIWIVIGVYLLYYCCHGVYQDGDTMTHWGVVLREIYENNRLPNFSTREVAYTSYPTGMAGYLYYFLYFVGYSEACAMFFQGVFVAASLLPLMEYVRAENQKTYWLQTAICCVVLVYSLNFNVRLADMKVDNVLGVLCFAGIAMGSCASMTLKARVFCALPILGMLAIIKNSGLIYCVFMAMPLVYAVLCEKQTWRIKLAQCGAMLITPLSLTYLWKCHVAMVFSNGNMSRHSASLDYMMQVYKSKTSEELLTILNNYMSIWFSTSSSRNGSAEWMVIFLFIGMLGLGVCVRKRLFGKGNSEGVIALAVLGGYISYKIALLGMYLFNMPDEDALGMGSYLRYTDSVLIILFLCMVMYFLSLLRDLNNSCGVKCKIEKTFVICLGVFMVAALPWTRPQYFKDLIRPDYENDGCYRQLLQIQQENHLPKKNGRVLVYTHTQYSGFYVEYCFRSPDAYSVNAESIDRAFTQTPDYYDYLVVLDHDELIDEVLMKYGYPTDVKCITLNRNEE